MESINNLISKLSDTVAKRMAERRVYDLNLTFDQLEKKSGIPGSTLHRMEHKAIKSLSLETVLKVSIALECNFLWLIGLSDDKYEKTETKKSDTILPKTLETYFTLPIEKRKAVDDLIINLSNI